MLSRLQTPARKAQRRLVPFQIWSQRCSYLWELHEEVFSVALIGKEPNPAGACYLPTVKRIYIQLRPRLSSDWQREKSGAAFLLLVAALVLSLELTLTRTWFVFFVPTALTLFSIAAALIVISTTGWRGIWSPSKPQDDARPKLWLVVLAFGLCVVENAFLNQVFQRLPQLQAYDADPVCSSSTMYNLALEKPGSMPAAQDLVLSGRACEVKWVQVTVDGQAIAYHPYTRSWSYHTFRGLRKGDFLVAQSAFGHISAVLYPNTDFLDRVFSPRGKIIPTGDNPVPRFEEAFMFNLWTLLFLIPAGAGILWWLWASVRNLPYESGTA